MEILEGREIMNKEISSRIRTISFLMTCGMVFYHCPLLETEYSSSVWDFKINQYLTNVFSVGGDTNNELFFLCDRIFAI